MKKENDLTDLVRDIIMKGIKGKVPCHLYMKTRSVSMDSYQDKIGIPSILELYMSNYFNIDGVMGLAWRDEKNNLPAGSIFIRFPDVSIISVQQHSLGRWYIKIDEFEINFLKAMPEEPVNQENE
jgi:hypothetical protein